MKIFLDTADTSIITKHFSSGLIDGVTTNPTLIKKSGRDPLEVYQELKDLGLQDISMEVVGNAEEMIEEGKKLAVTFGKCCTVKLSRECFTSFTIFKIFSYFTFLFFCKSLSHILFFTFFQILQ